MAIVKNPPRGMSLSGFIPRMDSDTTKKAYSRMKSTDEMRVAIILKHNAEAERKTRTD